MALLLCLAALLGTATAEVCAAELRAALAGDVPEQRVATALVRVALEAIEPALPVRRQVSQGWNDPNASWLAERGFLPSRWDENAVLTPSSWAALLANLQSPYGVTPRPLSGKTDPQTLLAETQAALQRVASSVRPLALLATRPGDRQEIVSVSVVWNWTPWPRLLIFQPKELSFGANGEIADLLARIGTCAWQPRAYFRTDLDTATSYYLGNADARVRLLATDLGPSWELVPDEQEGPLFSFHGDLLVGAAVAAIGFEGPGPSTWQVLRFLTTAKSNIGAFDLPYYLSFP